VAENEVTVIVGAGSGLGAALARAARSEGMRVAVAARDPAKLAEVARLTGATAVACDATEAGAVDALFERVGRDLGVPALVVYNASRRVRGPVADLDRAAVRQALDITAFGGFLVAQAAVRAMLPAGRGSLLFTGASASVKGYAQSAPFAMGKFALRGLAQSLARELSPQGLHIAHFVIDGAIRTGDDDPRIAQRGEDGVLLPDEIAKTYLHVFRQHRSAWAWEIELRPWLEKF
jgi:NAD(P)-dependent dehydrogenase (short-subunit alcohol dehydrogenase family)